MTFPLSIIPGGWGDEFEDDGPVSEKDKKAEKTKQPLQGKGVIYNGLMPNGMSFVLYQYDINSY